MSAVLSGFSVIWLIIGVGYIVGKVNVLGEHATSVLSRAAFFIASPCLLFVTISRTSFQDVIGTQFLIAALSAFSTLCGFLLLSKMLVRERTLGELVIGGSSASLVNSANLGFPIAAYVLGDAALAAPVVMFQLAVFIPLAVCTMDWTIARNRPNAQIRPKFLKTAAQSLTNPIIIGSLVGLLFSWQEWRMPGPVQESFELVAGAAIPLMLLAFGISLVGISPLDKHSGRRKDVLLAVPFKLLIHPLLAYIYAAQLFQLEGSLLLAAVVLASLPSAQNALVMAVRYQTGETVARDTVLMTTILGIPGMVIVALLLT
ncbi:AEC family transporter [Nesterenkonia ebinurensis]|uniref:AEC family transporter n=1 Tax=Nesterenkonia ebinurensis TaxID=2608252 RepID=UPI00123E0B47|nr:AEC family transporter [Nesterenkonia ebinurensis]